MASILGSENINKLSDDYVRDLLQYVTDKDKMANRIIKYAPKYKELISKTFPKIKLNESHKNEIKMYSNTFYKLYESL
jgi:hypothetical protein